MTTTSAGFTRYTGSRIHRVEDPRLLQGRGTFVDDIERPGMLHACFVRSPARSGPDRVDRRCRRLVRFPASARCSSPRTSTRVCTSSGTRNSVRRRRRRRDRRSPRARCASSATRSRSSLPTTGTSPRTRASSWWSTTTRCPPSSTTSPPSIPTSSSTRTTAATSSTTTALRHRRWSRCSRRPPTSSRSPSTSRRTPRCRSRRGASSSNAIRASARSRCGFATQAPHEHRAFCARLLGIPEHRVRAIARDTGGGFGQKILVQREEMCLMARRHEVAGAR